MTNSRRISADGEREFAAELFILTIVKLLRLLDQCRGGGYGRAPDIENTSDIADCLRLFAIEVKHYHAVSPSQINQWWVQTKDQAQLAGLVPMLAYRADRLPWTVVFPLHVLVVSTVATHIVTLSIEAFSTFLQQHINSIESPIQTTLKSNKQ